MHIKIFLTVGLFLGVFFFGPGKVFAASYYVDSQSGNDANAGTSTSAPWKTVAKVNTTALKPGDIVFFAKGKTYTGPLIVPSSGTAGSPITFDAYGVGELPTITGGNYVLSLENKQYIIVKNLKITQAASRNIRVVGGGNNQFRNLVLQNATFKNIEILDSSNNLIDGCDISNGGREGVFIKRQAENSPVVSHNVVSNNKIYNNIMPGVVLEGFRATHPTISNVVSHNEIHGNGDGIYIRYADSNDVHHNKIYNNNNKGYAGEGDGIPHQSASNNLVHDNEIYGQRRAGIHYWGGVPTAANPGYGNSHNNKAYRNFIHDNSFEGASGFYFTSKYSNNTVLAYNVVVNNGTATNPAYGIWQIHQENTGKIIINNTVVGNTRGQLSVQDTVVLRNNLLSNDGISFVTDTRNLLAKQLTGNPQFTSPTSRDYSLKNSSPAVDAGVSLSDLPVAALVDKDIAERSINGTRDAGAYEFGVTSPSVTGQPTGTSGLVLTVMLHGIGKGGDNVNEPGIGNMNPVRTQRLIAVDLYNVNNEHVGTHSGIVRFDATLGGFTGNVDFATLVPAGIYTVEVSLPNYLHESLPGFTTLSQGQRKNIPQFSLVTGDSNEDNKLSILDYNLLLDCFSELEPPKNCGEDKKKLSTDLTDDGVVNQFDYNLLLRELSVQVGE